MKKMPTKPKTQKAQIDTLWDFVHNHLWSRLTFLGWQVNFLIALVLVLLAVLLAR